MFDLEFKLHNVKEVSNDKSIVGLLFFDYNRLFTVAGALISPSNRLLLISLTDINNTPYSNTGHTIFFYMPTIMLYTLCESAILYKNFMYRTLFAFSLSFFSVK